MTDQAGRLLRGVAVLALPLLVALVTAPVAFAGGSVLPWHPQMVDLDVYRHAGQVLLDGGDIYRETIGLPFLYPPFSALAAVPFTLVPQAVAQLSWLLLNVVAVLAILYRLGLSGWVLSLAATAAVYFCEPVGGTLAYGQVGIVLVALVVLDLVPGPRMVPWRRRLLPHGVLTGLGAAIKLTPGLFAVYLLFARERRRAVTVIASFVVLTLGTALVLPAASGGYWWRLARGDSGTDSYHYLTNQSVYGTLLRITGLGDGPAVAGLVLLAVVAFAGAYAAARWHLRGKVGLAVALCGVAGLLASPISWSHHFVWVVPLAVVLLDRELPATLRSTGWVFVLWVTAAPFQRLPRGDDVELTYGPWHLILCSTTAILGLVFLAVALAAGTLRAADRVQKADRVRDAADWTDRNERSAAEHGRSEATQP